MSVPAFSCAPVPPEPADGLGVRPRTVRSAGAQRLRGAGGVAGAQSFPPARSSARSELAEPSDGFGWDGRPRTIRSGGA